MARMRPLVNRNGGTRPFRLLDKAPTATEMPNRGPHLPSTHGPRSGTWGGISDGEDEGNEWRGAYGPLPRFSPGLDSACLLPMVTQSLGWMGFAEEHCTYQWSCYKGCSAMRYLFRGGMKRERGAESVAQSGPFGTGPSWSH
jgi:hypothetical protein